MKVNPNNTSHYIKVIPRFTYTTSLTLNLYNEDSGSNENVITTTTLEDGYLELGFDYTFLEDSNYQLKITDANNEIVYRGKLFATTQDAQDYQLTKDLYYYE